MLDLLLLPKVFVLVGCKVVLVEGLFDSNELLSNALVFGMATHFVQSDVGKLHLTLTERKRAVRTKVSYLMK